MAKFSPLHDRILVRRVEEASTTRGGIIIPDSAKDKPQEGIVVSTGKGRTNDEGKTFPLAVHEGEEALHARLLARRPGQHGAPHLGVAQLGHALGQRQVEDVAPPGHEVERAVGAEAHVHGHERRHGPGHARRERRHG